MVFFSVYQRLASKIPDTGYSEACKGPRFRFILCKFAFDLVIMLC